MSTQQASNLYNAQQQGTAQTLADIIAAGDALKGDASGRIAGGTQGSYVGGSPGYQVDNRGTVNAQYNGVRDDLANVFGQGVSAIQAQAPQIQSDAQSRIDLIGNLIAGQNTAAQQSADSQVNDQVNAARAMGIDAAPQTSRASRFAAALGNSRNAFGSLNQSYFGTLRDTALSRNAAQAGAIQHSGDERQQALEAARQQALARAVYWVPGSRGKFVASYGSADKKNDKALISSITKTQKAIQASAASEAKQRAKDPGIRQSAVQANRRLN